MNFDPGIADAIEKKASTAHNALLMAKDEIARLTQKEEPASCWPWSHEWSKWQDRYAVAKESTIHGGVTATGCEETAMTTDLSNKTVEELRRTKCFRDKWGCIACTVEVVDELIRRLEEAQQRIVAMRNEDEAEMDGILALRAELGARDNETFPDFIRRLAQQNSAHDAEAKAEALEELQVTCSAFGIELPRIVDKAAAEYRAKAGRKE